MVSNVVPFPGCKVPGEVPPPPPGHLRDVHLYSSQDNSPLAVYRNCHTVNWIGGMGSPMLEVADSTGSIYIDIKAVGAGYVVLEASK